jgi:hypothetical protein
MFNWLTQRATDKPDAITARTNQSGFLKGRSSSHKDRPKSDSGTCSHQPATRRLDLVAGGGGL